LKIASNGAHLPDVKGKHFALIVARFYADLAGWLEEGARAALVACGAETIEVYNVPGCFELPLAAKRVMERTDVDGVVALGVVIRGETPHFDFVAGECARGIMTLQISSGIPIGFGVLTTDTREQAEVRADPARGNKGYEAAVAAATLVALDPKRPSETVRVGFR
jgi:6,7-dimethyl-8-ribityllumazine synthase